MKRIMKPDVKNDDPEYWETVLESHGLGIRQLGLEPEEVELEEEPETISLDELEDIEERI
jgi:hypothetical protein